MAAMGEEFEVIFDWNPETSEELSLVQGETVIVLDKASSGWWSGISTSGGVPKRGYFPKNYLKSKDADVVPATNVTRTGREFSINSLDAFDALVDNGFAIEYITKCPGGSRINVGNRLSVNIIAMSWDGSTTEATVFAEGPLMYTVGAQQVVAGLDEASLVLQVGDVAHVICAPAKGFGYAGQPPVVPSSSHVVYVVTVVAIIPMEAVAAATLPAEGHKYLMASGVAPKRVTKQAADGSNRRSVVLDLSGEAKMSADGGTEISDEMLARAAQSMGLGASEN